MLQTLDRLAVVGQAQGHVGFPVAVRAGLGVLGLAIDATSDGTNRRAREPASSTTSATTICEPIGLRTVSADMRWGCSDDGFRRHRIGPVDGATQDNPSVRIQR